MNRVVFRTTALTIAAALLLALPVAAQVIPAGEDRWVTPPNGGTHFEFPPGDVEALCGLPVTDDWDRKIILAGVAAPGADWDTAIRRLKDVDLDAGQTTTPIRLTHLRFRSLGTHRTPCGELLWEVKALDQQRRTKMEFIRHSDTGGVFHAEIAVNVVFAAVDAGSGAILGYLYYSFDLPDQGGTPWSFGPGGIFRPGIDEDENCFDVLREKLSTLPTDAGHEYYIENLIAQGKCSKHQ